MFSVSAQSCSPCIMMSLRLPPNFSVLKRSEPVWAEERINITVQIPESTRKTICTGVKNNEKSLEKLWEWYWWNDIDDIAEARCCFSHLQTAFSKWTSKNRATIVAQKTSNIQSKQNLSDRDVFTLSLHRRSSTISNMEFKVRAKHRPKCNSLDSPRSENQMSRLFVLVFGSYTLTSSNFG